MKTSLLIATLISACIYAFWLVQQLTQLENMGLEAQTYALMTNIKGLWVLLFYIAYRVTPDRKNQQS